MSLLANSNAISAGGYPIQRSLRFRSSASAYLNRTFGTPTAQNTWTLSFWAKRGTLGSMVELFSAGSANRLEFLFAANNTFQIADATTNFIITSAVFRDPSAWYHIVVKANGSGAAIQVYVNGAVTTNSTTNNLTTSYWNASGTTHYVGCLTGPASFYDGYLAEVNFIDGQALTPSSFGQTDPVTGVWQPLKYAGTYGTNGFYLPFSDNTSATTLAYDKSGNGNNWTPNNISTTAGVTYDSMTDVPTLTSATAANYCTYNSAGSAPSVTLSAANLDASHGAFSSTCGAAGTFGVSSGKWYWEVTINAISSGAPYIGIVRSDQLYPFTTLFANNSQGYAYRATGQKRNNGVDASYGATYAAGDVIGVALDMDAGTLVFYKNNASQGTAYSSLSGVFMPIDANGTSGGTYTSTANFGQRPFSYTPPSGFVALNTYNLPTPTILAGNKYMDATLYSGTSASKSVTNAGSFQPDLVWIKSRSAATDHKLTDSVRGVTKALISDTTGAETTDTNGLTAFNSNGFTVGSDSVYNNGTGPATYVGWQWQAGKGTTSSNTSGSITSTVSVNTTAGFSVVTYTGDGSASSTVGHGLGVAPSMIICKARNSAIGWIVYQSSFGAGNYMVLNNTNAAQTIASSVSGAISTSPTSSVFGFTAGSSNVSNVNGNGTTYVAYCWAQISGFSAFGKYTGNGSTDGPFVYCGFKPKYVLIKCSSAAGYDWWIEDSSRDTYNPEQNILLANSSASESTAGSPFVTQDFLSNGFKLRTSYAAVNTSSATFIYAAFAENPFKYANAR